VRLAPYRWESPSDSLSHRRWGKVRDHGGAGGGGCTALTASEASPPVKMGSSNRETASRSIMYTSSPGSPRTSQLSACTQWTRGHWGSRGSCPPHCMMSLEGRDRAISIRSGTANATGECCAWRDRRKRGKGPGPVTHWEPGKPSRLESNLTPVQGLMVDKRGNAFSPKSGSPLREVPFPSASHADASICCDRVFLSL
jgi:hypothetical protein